MVLVGFLAKKRHGKDTAANYLTNNYNFTKISIADPLKYVLKILFEFNDEQLYGDEKEIIDKNWGISPRNAMQYLGTEIFRERINELIPGTDADFWINLAILKYQNMKKENPNVKCVIADVRFQNEVDKIHDSNGHIIKIERPNVNNVDEHQSEIEIDSIENYDHHVLNDSSLVDYYAKLDKIIEFILSN